MYVQNKMRTLYLTYKSHYHSKIPKSISYMQYALIIIPSKTTYNYWTLIKLSELDID